MRLVLVSCTEALEIDSKNVKALYRRGRAHFDLHEFSEAKEDFSRGTKIDPTNKAISVQLIRTKRALKEEAKKARKAFGNIFERAAADREQQLKDAGMDAAEVEELEKQKDRLENDEKNAQTVEYLRRAGVIRD